MGGEELDPAVQAERERLAREALRQYYEEEDRQTLAQRIGERLFWPYKAARFLKSNWALLATLLIAGGSAAATVVDFARIPADKSVDADGALQAIWSTTEIDIQITDGFNYASGEDDSVVFNPMALMEGLPRIVMKYTPEEGRYLSFERVKDSPVGDYLRVAEYDNKGNAYPLKYENVLFQPLLPEECSLEVIDNELTPEKSCTDPDSSKFRGYVDHDIVYTGYPLFGSSDIVQKVEAGYQAAVDGNRNCILSIYYQGSEVVTNPDGSKTYLTYPKLAYFNVMSAIKARIVDELTAQFGLPVFNERGLRTVLFADDEQRIAAAIDIFGEAYVRSATTQQLHDIFSLEKTPLPVPLDLRTIYLGKTTSELLLDMKDKISFLTMPDGLTRDTQNTDGINAGCVPVTKESQAQRIKNHEVAQEFGGSMVGVPFKEFDESVMTPTAYEEAHRRLFEDS